jgi:isopropylmalate/homocitrate/citramalate synthase
MGSGKCRIAHRPHDIGRTYEAIIRNNTQSGKGGFAFVLENDYGFDLPKLMKAEFGKIMQKFADAKGTKFFRTRFTKFLSASI